MNKLLISAGVVALLSVTPALAAKNGWDSNTEKTQGESGQPTTDTNYGNKETGVTGPKGQLKDGSADGCNACEPIVDLPGKNR